MVRRKVGEMGQVRRGGIVNYELGTSYKLAPAGGHSLISWEHDIFYAWFVLQHFRGYIPFITRVSNSHDVSFLKQLR